MARAESSTGTTRNAAAAASVDAQSGRDRSAAPGEPRNVGHADPGQRELPRAVGSPSHREPPERVQDQETRRQLGKDQDRIAHERSAEAHRGPDHPRDTRLAGGLECQEKDVDRDERAHQAHEDNGGWPPEMKPGADYPGRDDQDSQPRSMVGVHLRRGARRRDDQMGRKRIGRALSGEAPGTRGARIEEVFVAVGIVIGHIQVAVLDEADRVHQVERLIARGRAARPQERGDERQVGKERERGEKQKRPRPDSQIRQVAFAGERQISGTRPERAGHLRGL